MPADICVVAILKDEDRFIHEWIAYHQLLGVSHFYLYDNDPRLPLKKITKCHEGYVTVIDWLVSHDDARYKGKYIQNKAYNHFLKNFSSGFKWVAFIDADEFIVLRKHKGLKPFLQEFERFDAVSLNWHVFGHNGYYNDPKGLVTSLLTRRMAPASIRVKTITKVNSIAYLRHAHWCVLKRGSIWVDANKRKYKRNALYHGQTEVAHINHYQCRSFRRWMSRPSLGAPGCFVTEKGHEWRFNEEKCLRQFVCSMAKDKNELVDEYMLKYSSKIKAFLSKRLLTG